MLQLHLDVLALQDLSTAMKRKRLRVRVNGQRMIIERYGCDNQCGHIAAVMRRPAQRRAPKHPKTMYCPRCRVYTQHEKQS